MSIPMGKSLEDVPGSELRELENAAPENSVPSTKSGVAPAVAVKRSPIITGGHGPLVKINGLALAFRGWMSGKPISDLDRAKVAKINAHNNWANYW